MWADNTCRAGAIFLQKVGKSIVWTLRPVHSDLRLDLADSTLHRLREQHADTYVGFYGDVCCGDHHPGAPVRNHAVFALLSLPSKLAGEPCRFATCAGTVRALLAMTQSSPAAFSA